MSSLDRPPDELTERAFEKGQHVGEPWCGTVYCPVCLEETFGYLELSKASERTRSAARAASYALREFPRWLLHESGNCAEGWTFEFEIEGERYNVEVCASVLHDGEEEE